MADIIHLLPDSIANQIAAGEVVQRPASVIKELLENCLDAGADDIQVIIRDAGKSAIQIIDNGHGMSMTDARMCFERHATSKINSTEDLFRIRTMGFRGEALASIAAVAQVELKSRRPEDELGTKVIIEGSNFIKQEPESSPAGTSLLVKNLFYNVPARRNFLKSAPVEMRHIIDEFQHVAISSPGTTMKLYHNDLEIYNLPAGKLARRIINLFGKNYQEQLVACQEETEHVNIRGYIGVPGYAKKTRGEQFLFVNNRFIRNNYLNHAIQSAYEGLLAPNFYPFYALFLDMEPTHVDVNVHPSKTEVKFLDERALYSVIRSVVKQALGTHNITPSLNFETDVNFSLRDQFGGTSSGRTIADLNYERLRSKEFSNLENRDSLYEGLTSGNLTGLSGRQESMNPETLFPEGNETHSFKGEAESIESPVTFQIHNRFIFSQVKSGLMIIDQAAAFYRILYDQSMQRLKEKSASTQKLIFPVTVELNPTDFTLVMDIRQEIRDLGFDIDSFGSHSVIINGIPVGLDNINEKEVFEDLIEQFKQNRDQLKLNISENLARSFARYSSLKYLNRMTNTEQQMLIDQLFACSNPNYSPSGEPVYTVIPLNQIENLIKKKS